MKTSMEHSQTQCSQTVLTMPHKAAPAEEESCFANNLEYLKALEFEARLKLSLAYLQNNSSFNNIAIENDLPFIPLPADEVNTANVTSLLEEITAANRLKVKLSQQNGIQFHFENLCDMHHLDNFERMVMMLLYANNTCAAFRGLFNKCFKGEESKEGEMMIGSLLSIISSDYCDQLRNRKYFSIKGNLIKAEIVCPRYSFDHKTNIATVEVGLHERIVRYIIGDNNVYDIAMLHIIRETPTIDMKTVILPEEIKQDVIKTASNFVANQNNRKHLSVKNHYGYGTGLTFLFYGPSGTGKTMFAHALAKTLNGELLSMNMGAEQRSRNSFEEVLKYIFKEAQLTNAIVFFDECDDLIEENSWESRELLIQIEKAECITILATNKVESLDPAFDRRITVKVPFRIPDAIQQKNIWKSLVPENVAIADDVNFEELAKRYFFTGGLIKNTLFMAINNARNNHLEKGSVLTRNDIEKAASHQAESMYKDCGCGRLVVPHISIDELPLKSGLKQEIRALSKLVKELAEEGIGLKIVIGSSDIRTGLDCKEVMAAEIDRLMRLFYFSHIGLNGFSGKIKDPFTHKEIFPLEFAFTIYPGYHTITIIEDLSSQLRDNLHSMAKDKPELSAFWNMVKKFKGILIIVTTPINKQLLPADFSHYIEIKHPPEELQIRQWEMHLKDSLCGQEEIIDLVECYPMHLKEIDFIARQASISARIKGVEKISIEDLKNIIVRNVQTTPVLFGNV